MVEASWGWSSEFVRIEDSLIELASRWDNRRGQKGYVTCALVFILAQSALDSIN